MRADAEGEMAVGLAFGEELHRVLENRLISIGGKEIEMYRDDVADPVCDPEAEESHASGEDPTEDVGLHIEDVEPVEPGHHGTVNDEAIPEAGEPGADDPGADDPGADDDEISKIHEILKGLDEEQDANDDAGARL